MNEAVLIRETATVPQTNRTTLSYYSPPQRRRVINEAAVVAVSSDGTILESATESMEVFPDAAVASLGDHTLLEVVIGNDDRVKVAPELLGRNPWRQICALRIRSTSNRTYVGTAWFIAPGVLATAGHCVFLHDDGRWPQFIDVIPSKSGQTEPFGRVRATRFATVDGWTQQRSRDFDYGVIFLDDTRPGTLVGNFEVAALANAELGGVVTKVSGYPADRERAEFQFFHERPLVDVTQTRLVYDIDTFGGQSGSPIWVDTNELGLIAVGIHTTGGLSSNSGTRISEEVLDNLISWSEEQ
jgi:V8-like Glu-specific endopeptidase